MIADRSTSVLSSETGWAFRVPGWGSEAIDPLKRVLAQFEVLSGQP